MAERALPAHRRVRWIRPRLILLFITFLCALLSLEGLLLATGRWADFIPLANRATVVDDGTFNAFPDLAMLSDGRLLLVYETGTNARDGKILERWSSDGGHTWTDPETVLDTPADLNPGGLTALRDGSLILVVGVADATRGSRILLLRSIDGGRVWSAPEELSDGFTTMRAAWNPLVERADGTWLLPVSGLDAGDGGAAAILRSEDRGRTWSRRLVADEPGGWFADWQIAELGGRLVGVIREQNHQQMWITSSVDGWSWAAPKPAFVGYGRPELIVRDDVLWVCYRRGPATSSQANVCRTTRDEIHWTAETTLTADPRPSLYASLAALPGGEIAAAYAVRYSLWADRAAVYITWLSGMSGD